jgi:hypothetical protein
VQAIRIGEAKYVLVTFVMCIVLLVAVAAEGHRTRAWRWLPQWDFMDTTCLVLASAVAGEDVVGGMCQGVGAKRVEWTGRGGGGGWREGGEQGAREGCGEEEEVPAVRLRLGRKVVSVALAQQAGAGDGDEKEVQLAAVSLWTSGAKGIVPLT